MPELRTHCSCLITTTSYTSLTSILLDHIDRFGGAMVMEHSPHWYDFEYDVLKRRLKALQQQLARCTPGSKHRSVIAARITKVHRVMARQSKTMSNIITTELCVLHFELHLVRVFYPKSSTLMHYLSTCVACAQYGGQQWCTHSPSVPLLWFPQGQVGYSGALHSPQSVATCHWQDAGAAEVEDQAFTRSCHFGDPH